MSDERKRVEEEAVSLGYPADRVKKMRTLDLQGFIRSRSRSRHHRPRPPRRDPEEFTPALERETGYTDAEIAQIQMLMDRQVANERPVMTNSDNPSSLRLEPIDVRSILSEDNGIEVLDKTVSHYLDKAFNLTDALKCYGELLADGNNSLCHTERNDLSRQAKVDAESISDIKDWCENVVDAMKDVIISRTESANRLRHHRASSEHMDKRTQLLQILHTKFRAQTETLVAHIRE